MRERTVDSDGVRLSVIERGDPDAPTLLLVHGFPDTQTLWSPVAERLADRFHVVSYDLRGAGRSSVPSGRRPWAMECLVADAAAVLDAVSPGRSVHLVGHDWGAIQGWEFLYAAPTRERFRSFTCVGGASLDHSGLLMRQRLRDHDRAGLLSALGQARRSWYMLLIGTSIVFRPLWRHVLAPQWGRVLALREGIARSPDFPPPSIADDGANLAGLYWRTPLERILSPQRSEPVAIPVQVIRAEHDRFLAPGTLDGIERFAPRLTRASVPGGHWAPRSCPDRLAALIAEHALAAEGEPRAEPEPAAEPAAPGAAGIVACEP
jgi:pimeloyl-ACP methyl ester carboxylesterase